MKNILLADDDADDRMFFEDALKNISIPSHLTVADDGVVMMEKLASLSEPPSLIIFLDLNMPRKNGLQCLKEIRHTPRLQHIPIIILSTSAHEDEVTATYREGANYYISKPASFNQLTNVIEKVLALDLSESHSMSRENFIITPN